MINDDIIRLRALEPEDLECLYKWENDMDLWEVSDTLTPFSLFTLKKYIETCRPVPSACRYRHYDPQYGKSKTGLRDSRHSPDDRLLFRNIGTKPDLQ